MSEELALRMGMFHYSEYYTFDHVFYKENDRIAEGILPFETSIVKGTWLKHIRVAFEHENRLGLLKYDFEKNNWIQLDCLNKFQ